MQITYKNFNEGKVRLIITDLDDLWSLSHLIESGDLVKGKTTRKVKIGEGENAKTAKKTYTLTIEAEDVKFSEDGNSLRINGKIKEGPDDIPRESYHAIAIEVGSEISITKPKWLKYQQQKLEEAAEKKYTLLICLLDREEAIFVMTKKFGYEVLTKISGEVPKKGRKVEIKKEFQKEIIQTLETYYQRYSPKNIILASPAFYKETVFNSITNKEIRQKIIQVDCSDVSEQAVEEVIRSSSLKEILKDDRARKEQLLVEDLLKEIRKEGLAVYGYKEVRESILNGAISTLLITNEFIRKKREEGSFRELDELMRMVEAVNAKMYVLSSKSDSGKKINGLGGIAGILKYKIR